MQLAVFHLYNDFSGSPKVLAPVLRALAERGVSMDLHTSRGGVLDSLKDFSQIRFHQYNYIFSPSAATTMVRYAEVQLCTFFSAFRYLFSSRTFYINTLLPIGPALTGRIMGKRVVYHYHENADAKGAFYKILAKGMQWLASDIICVSDYQRSFLSRKKRVYVIPNALPEDFASRLTPNTAEAFERKRVLMLGSLKGYKGTKEFVRLAEMLPEYQFELVINDSQTEINAYWENEKLPRPANLKVFSRQEDVAPFYNRASVVLNLSNREECIETFGLTALEAMTAGLPVIVPTVGGIAEMVEDGENGYKIDVQNLPRIAWAIKVILSDKRQYERMAEGALKRAKEYSFRRTSERIYSLLSGQ